MVQWSFRKIGTIGTLPNQTDIGVWVQAPPALAGVWGTYNPEKIEIAYAKS